MLVMYTDLHEKVEWLYQFLHKSYSIHKKTEEMLLDAIRIPRKTQWNTSSISFLIENTETKRKEIEEVITLYEMTILKDITSLLDKTNEKINFYIRERQAFEIKTDGLRVSINEKRSKYKESIENDTLDTWLCAVQYKYCVVLYLSQKEKNEQEYKLKVNIKENDYTENVLKFESIIKNFLKIENINFSNIAKIPLADTNSGIDYTSIQNYNINSDGLDDSFDINIVENPLHVSIQEYINETESDNRLEKDIDNAVIKYGIFKTKRTYQSTWHPSFVVYTREHFLHMFELRHIINYNKNIKAKHLNIISRIMAQPTRLLLFFENNSLPKFDMNEENEFFELCNEIYKSYDFLCQDDIRYTLQITSKSVRFNKATYEIVIEGKNSSSLSNIFAPKSTKIKSFILKDIYELYFGFNDKINNTLHPITSEPISKNDEQKIEADDDPEEKPMWTNIKAYNPWEES